MATPSLRLGTTGGTAMGSAVGTLTRALRRPITGDQRVDANLYQGIDITNPFGRGPGNPMTYGALVRQVNYGLGQANNLRNMVSNFRSNLGQGGAGGAFGTTGAPFSPALGNQAMTAPTAASAPSDLFSLVNVSKDPSGQFDRVNRGLLSQVENFRPDYSAERGATSDVLNKLSGSQADVDANRADTNSLIAKFNALSPTLDQQTLDQTNQLNRVYDPNGLKAEFAANTEAARNAERQASDLAMRRAIFQNRLASPEGTNSSYGRAQLADATGRIAVETAARDADRRRQDTASLLSAQERNLGRVQDLNTANLMRGNIPIEARSRVLDQEVNLAMRRLQAAGQAVNINQLTDQLSTVGRQLGMTGQALQNYLATNFFGVQKQGDDYPLYITGGGGGGGVRPYFSDSGGGGDNYGGGMGGGGGGYQGGPNNDYGSYVSDGKGGQVFKQSDKLKAMRQSQGWRQDRDGNYTINSNGTSRRWDADDFIYSNNLPSDYSGYGDQSSSLYYPGYSRTDTQNMQDYYQGNINGGDLMDFYSGEYNW